MSRSKKLTVLVIMALVTGIIGIAYANPTYYTALSTTCPTAICTSCHNSPSGPPPLTAYGTAFSNIPTHLSNPSGAIATLGCPGGTPTPTPAPTPAPTPMGQMSMPTGQQPFTYLPVATPSPNNDPALTQPIGVGPIANNGATFTLRVTLGQFSGPVDIYLVIYTPSLNPNDVYLIRADNTIQPSAAGIQPWKSNVTTPIDEVLFNNVPASVLPSGQYVFGLLVAPAGSGLQNYYFWMTGFDIAGVDGAALYAANCAGCHGALATSSKGGRTAAQITAAISSIPTMSSFTSLSATQIQAIANALNGQASQSSSATVLPAPGSQQGFSVSPATVPTVSGQPGQANPFAFGTAATGGTTMNLQIDLGSFSAPVDVYLGFSVASQPGNVYIFASDNTIRPLSAGLVPWIAATPGPVNESLLSNVPTSNLPPDIYTFYLLVTPAGNMDTFYLWTSNLTINPASAPDGAALYALNCAGCHGPLATSAKTGRTAAQITSAIGSVGAMSGLSSSLSQAQIQAIAAALATSAPMPTPMPTPGSMDGSALYAQYCSGCHGSLATSAKAGRTAAQIQAALGSVGAMSGLPAFTAAQVQAIANALAGVTSTPTPTPPPGGIDGAALYSSNCSGCHGALASSSKRGRTAAQITSAINSVGAMSGLSLTSAQIAAIASALSSTPAPTPGPTPTPPPGGIDGAALYSSNCSGCHGALASSSKRGRTASQITSAINSVGAMSGLSLTSAQIAAIASALSSTPAPTPTPTPTPGALDGAALYTSNCSGCHGALASSSKAGRTASQIQSAISGNAGGVMGALSSLTSAIIQAIANALATGTPPPPSSNHPSNWLSAHQDYADSHGTSSCTACHGANLTGGAGPSCYTCHGKVW